MQGKCEDCRFRDGSVCKRYPPTVSDQEGTNFYPFIRAEFDWCGEFRYKQLDRSVTAEELIKEGNRLTKLNDDMNRLLIDFGHA